MQRLRRKGPEIPDGIGVFEMGLRVAFLGVNKVRKFNRITDEKDRRIIADQIIIAFFGIKFHGKAAWIAHSIGRPQLPGYCREANEHRRAFAHLRQEGCFSIFGQILSDFKITMSSGAFGMNYTLRNTLPVEMCQLFQQMNILQQCGSTGTGSH
ncbi:hypothetical protein D3C73_998260 [compost metagenome]